MSNAICIIEEWQWVPFYIPFQILLVDEKSDISFEQVDNEEVMIEMMEKMKKAFLNRAKASPAFLKRIIGMAEEAAKRNII